MESPFYHVYHSSTILPPAFPIPFGAKRLRHQTRGQGIWLTHPGIAIEFRMGRRSLEELSGNREGFPDEMEGLEELSGKTGQIPDGTKVLRGLSAKPTGGSRHFLIRKVPGIIRCRGLV